MQSVELWQVLARREGRANRQRELLAAYHRPLVWFTMNIAGPVKTSPRIRRGFRLGCKWLEQQWLRVHAHVVYKEEYHGPTGEEAGYVVDLDPLQVKELTLELEEETPLGRLFDMDVLTPDGRKVERQELGRPERRCLLCGGPARVCARSRAHTLAALQQATAALLEKTLMEYDTHKAAELTCRALLYEVATTPKPGLVDCDNNGSHRDMDLFTFLNSTSALWPYFARCTALGRETAALPPEQTFARLRGPGQMAENAMFGATHGVNTHKGAIFTLGAVCAALGRLPSTAWCDPEMVLREVAAMAQGLVARAFSGLTPTAARTAGQKLYLQYRLAGVRGELEAGLPAVQEIGLPALERGLAQGKTLPEAGAVALLAILAGTTDTNLIARSNRQTQQAVSAQVAHLLHSNPFPGKTALKRLDRQFIAQNLSPGGSADLLAVCYLLYFLKTELA